MAKSNRLEQIVAGLRKEESFLAAELGKIRDALAALGGVGKDYQRGQVVRQVKTVARNVRKMTAAQKKAVSTRMKKYWVARRKAQK